MTTNTITVESETNTFTDLETTDCDAYDTSASFNYRNCRSSRSARLGATLNMILTAIGGGGIFGNVFGASQLGLFGFLLVTCCSMLFTFVSIHFLCVSSDICRQYSCYGLSRRFLGGKKGECLTKLFILFGNWSYIVNIIQIFADYMSYMLQIWTQSTTGFWTSRQFVCSLGLLLIFPFITVKNIKHLEKLSGVLLFFAVCILIVMLLNAFSAITYNQSSVHYLPTNYGSIFRGLPPITWCWAVQFNVLPTYLTLDPLTRYTQMHAVSYSTVIILFVYYTLFGVSAIIVYGQEINNDFITNLDYNNENYVFYYGIELSTITQLILCVITFASIPVFAFEARRNLHYIVTDIFNCWLNCCMCIQENAHNNDNYHDIEAENETSPLIVSENEEDGMVIYRRDYSETSTSIFVEGAALMVSAAVVALLLRNLNWSLSIVGATYSCYIAYFMPSVVYFMSIRHNSNLSRKQIGLKYMSILVFIYGIIVCGAGLSELVIE